MSDPRTSEGATKADLELAGVSRFVVPNMADLLKNNGCQEHVTLP
jgi:hypothetical protein